MVEHSAHTIHYTLSTTSENHYIAQCKEFQSIIVQADTKEAVKIELLTAVKGYMLAFPEEHDTLVAVKSEPEELIVEV